MNYQVKIKLISNKNGKNPSPILESQKMKILIKREERKVMYQLKKRNR